MVGEVPGRETCLLGSSYVPPPRRPARPAARALKKRPGRDDMTGMTRPVAAATALVLFVSVLLLPSVPTASAAAVTAQGKVHGGFYSGIFQASGDLNAVANAVGKRVSIGGTFGSTGNDTTAADPSRWSNTRERLDEIWRGGATPFYNLGVSGATAKSIASGQQDVHIKRWIDHMKMYLDLGGGRSLILAPLQEMNGNWVTYGCDPTQFRAAYRRIHDMIRARGIDETKVRFAFAPNGWTSPGCGTIHDYYPGDHYVDVIGISAYRWSDGGSVQQIMGNYIDDLASRYPSKPLVIAQTAAWPSGTKSQWIRDMFDWAAAHPHVVAIIYFNFDKHTLPNETDWRVWVPPSTVNAGWKDGMLKSSTVYEFPLTSWFKPGPLTLSGLNTCPQNADCDTVAFQESNGRFQVFTHATSGDPMLSFFYGNPGDVVISGDWDCDGVETLGLYRRSTGFVYLRNSNTEGPGDVSFFFGNPGDIPVAGNFDGKGCDTVSIFRPSEGRFYISNRPPANGVAFTADYAFYFGNPGDKPFVGDFNGDGIDTVGLHRESTGYVYFRNSNNQGVADFEFFYGLPGDVLIAGDWDGNGTDTVGVYRRSNGMFYIRNSHSTGNAHSQVFVGIKTGVTAIRP